VPKQDPTEARVSGGSAEAVRRGPRALPLLVTVVVAGVAAYLSAVGELAIGPTSWSTFAGIAVLLAAAVLTEAFPVPIESLPAGHVSLAAVFVIGAAAVYGWAEATVVAVGGRALVEVAQRRKWDDLAYNTAVYALAAAAAGGATVVVSTRSETAALAIDVVVAATAFFVVNVSLITARIARTTGYGFVSFFAQNAARTVGPFAIMASGSLMLAVLWDRSPLLSLALVGPLLAIALYQRSMHRALVATRLALTDPLTGLGNPRHFHERLQQELDAAAATGKPLALCLLDVDDLKRINDLFGHPVGDRLLRETAAFLRQGGEAFRVGGDEFALLLPGRAAGTAVDAAEAVMRRVATIEIGPSQSLRASAGVAVFPAHCADRSELYRCADDALYSSKREGKNRVHVYRPQPPRPELKAS
jgi:diguanylate cyclase (GGDEF)-like protein